MFNLKKAIKVEAARQDLTMAKVANSAGMSPQHLSKIVAHNNCNLETLIRIADSLHIRLSDLVRNGEI